MKPTRPWHGLALVAALGLIVLWLALAPPRAGEARVAPDSADAGRSASPSAALGAPLAANEERDPLRARDAADPPAEPPAAGPRGDELVRALAELGRLYAARDVPALQARLEQLLADPETAFEVLALLSAGAWRDDGAVLHGVFVLLESALVCYNAPGPFEAVDGRALVVAVLRALPLIDEPAFSGLIERLAAAAVGDRPVLDLSYLREILDLRAAWPERAASFSALFENLARGLAAGEGYEEFYSLLVTELSDPVAVRVALAALLRLEDGRFLPLAEELFRGAESAELRAAIAQAVASTAPVDRAAEVLARLTDGLQHAQLLTLGTRAGGLEALEREYDELAAGGDQDPLARRMLVTGMLGGDEGRLLAIATSDPNASVRAQALLTASLSKDASPAVFETLRAAYELRDDPALGVQPELAVMAAQNVLGYDTGGAREQAKGFLLWIAADETIAAAVRWKAVNTLRDWVAPEAFAGLAIDGEPVQ